jgi:hypothetical protein
MIYQSTRIKESWKIAVALVNIDPNPGPICVVTMIKFNERENPGKESESNDGFCCE